MQSITTGGALFFQTDIELYFPLIFSYMFITPSDRFKLLCVCICMQKCALYCLWSYECMNVYVCV